MDEWEEFIALEDSDLERGDFSFFMEEQAEKDALWEYFLENCKSGGRYGFWDTHDSQWYYFLVMPWGWVKVGYYNSGNHDLFGGQAGAGALAPFNTIFHCTWSSATQNWDFENAEFESLGYRDCTTITASQWFQAFIQRQFRNSDGTSKFAELTGWWVAGRTFDQLFDIWNTQIRKAWLEDGKPGMGKSAAGRVYKSRDEIGQQVENALGLSRSAQFWPELPGMKTAYVDNIGVFVADWMGIDFNMTPLVGNKMLVCTVEREPTQAQESKRNWGVTYWLNQIGGALMSVGGASTGMSGSSQYTSDYWAPKGGGVHSYQQGSSQISGGSNILGKIVSAATGLVTTELSRQTAARRVAMPRIRAFGRQGVDTTKASGETVDAPDVPTYAEYAKAVDALGPIDKNFDRGSGTNEWHSYNNGEKFVLKLPVEWFNGFVNSIDESMGLSGQSSKYKKYRERENVNRGYGGPTEPTDYSSPSGDWRQDIYDESKKRR